MKRRILIVDDEEGIRRIFVDALSEAGYEVRPAGSSSEALRLVGEETFHLVLLDLSLPDSKGLDLLKSLRGMAPDLPVMILTGLPLEKKLVSEAKAAGAREFISKTNSLVYVLEKMERFFSYG